MLAARQEFSTSREQIFHKVYSSWPTHAVVETVALRGVATSPGLVLALVEHVRSTQTWTAVIHA